MAALSHCFRVCVCVCLKVTEMVNLVLQWITVCFWGKVCLVLLLWGEVCVCVCVCVEIILSIDWCPKIFYWMLTGFILFHRVLKLPSLHHWLLHRAFRVDTTSIPIFHESWSTSFRLFCIRFYSPYLKKLLEMVSFGWLTQNIRNILCVLNFCLWNWRLYILIAFIFSGSLQWDNFLLYTWLFSMSKVKTTWIRSGVRGDLQLISCLLFCQQKYAKQCIELSPMWTVALFSKKKCLILS
jgi:hypothetical protein